MDSDSTIWVIVGVVILLVVFFLIIVGIGLTIFFVSRKRKKAADMRISRREALALLGAGLTFAQAPFAAGTDSPPDGRVSRQCLCESCTRARGFTVGNGGA